MRTSTAMLTAFVAVFVILFMVSEYFMSEEEGGCPANSSSIANVDSGLLAVVSQQTGNTLFLRAPDVISYSLPEGFAVNGGSAEALAALRETSGKEIRAMACWRVTDTNRADFMKLVSEPEGWIEPISQLTRALRFQRFLGVDLHLQLSDYSLPEQERIITFFDTFARNLRLRGLVPALTFSAQAMEKTRTIKGNSVINPDPSILQDVAITESGDAMNSTENELYFFPSLARSADFVILLDVDPKDGLDVFAGLPLERCMAPGWYDTVPYRLTADWSNNPFAVYQPFSSLLPIPTPAASLSPEEAQFAAALNAVETHDHHLRIGNVFINRSEHRLEIPALLNLSAGLVEVVMCDPKNGRVHESLLVSKTRPFDLQVALFLLGLKNGTPEVSDSSVRMGDAVDIQVLVHGGRGSVPVQEWIVRGGSKTPIANDGFIFVGSGFRDKRCLADDSGNLVDIDSMDSNTILWMVDRTPDTARFYANSALMPHYVGDQFPTPVNEMTAQPIRPKIPADLEIPVTVIITPRR